MRTVDRELPLETEVPLVALLRVRRDDCDEQPTVVDLLPDAMIPGVPASQLALVEPDFDAGRAKSGSDARGRLDVLRGVAQEHRSSRCARRLGRLLPHARSLDS